VGTWEGSPAPGGKERLENQTLREIVHTSIGGDAARIKISSAFGTEPLVVGAAHLALRSAGSSIDFDKATQYTAHPKQFLPAYDSGDHLHPNNAGYKATGDVIDWSVFNEEPKNGLSSRCRSLPTGLSEARDHGLYAQIRPLSFVSHVIHQPCSVRSRKCSRPAGGGRYPSPFRGTFHANK
jgi:hypothetical protein